ncbi:MocR-like pyridoxine biosynthesis transcription factor PdxR [Paenibacillus sp. DMB20]|uniref:MocR-like pyridoxine biosynthesis transcription factor PdxR n=1 Tax=Paenibacillus sp. DMB20 TaxID=1642570 RepID=UPI002E0F9ABE
MMEFGLPMESYLERYAYKYLALYHALRDAILDGRLQEGERLPATRELARLYGMSRGSAAQSYDMLLAEGYVQALVGSGTFVARGAARVRGESPCSTPDPVLSTWGRRLIEGISTADHRSGILQPVEDGQGISFIGDRIASDFFPYPEWRSCLNYAGSFSKEPKPEKLSAAGYLELRRAIAGHLRFTRGIQAEAEHIIMFSGSMQGILLLSQLLIDPGDSVVLENPCYHGIRKAVLSCAGKIVPAEVDREGIVPDHWNAKLLFVTPSRQYPTGSVLTLERRRQLLEWARVRQAVIIEDDYDSEFRWGGRPMEPLKTLDDEGRVVYVGSFSKTMLPGLRLGYAVLPEALVKPAAAAKALYEPVSPGLLEQRALARFISKGGYGRHLRRMTRLYGERHRTFCREMEAKASHLFNLQPGDAGLHVYAEWIHGTEEYERFKTAAGKKGVSFRDAALYRLSPGPPAACFGFAHLDETDIIEGIDRMVRAWKDMQNI